MQIFDLREALEQDGEAVAQAEVFAVERGVLADQRNFAHACGGEIFSLRAPRIRSGGCGIFREAAESRRKCRDGRSLR